MEDVAIVSKLQVFEQTYFKFEKKKEKSLQQAWPL